MSKLNILKLLLSIILVFAGIDILIKICESINWFRRRNLRQRIFKKIISESTLAEAEDEADFFHNYFHGEDIRFDLNKAVILTDILLTVVMFILFIVETGGSVPAAGMPIIIITRGYLKLPFAWCLMLHYYRIKEVQNHSYPAHTKYNFKTYKDKVLYTLKKIISEYYQFADLSNAINDLNWCIFIIANDYLQISNSISSAKPTSIENKDTTNAATGNGQTSNGNERNQISDADISFHNIERRFSKTKTMIFGERNKI